MPRLVVPEVATAANRPSSPCSAMAASRFLPVSRPRSSRLDPQDVDVHHLGGGDDRGVGLVGGGDPQPRRALAAALGQVGVAGGDQGRQVADRAAGHETAAGLVGHAGQVGDPAQRLVLGVHRARALEPAAAVDRGGAHHQVEQRGRLGRCGGDEGQIARVVDRHACVGEHLVEDAQRLGAAQPVGGDRLAHGRGQFGGRARTVQRHRVESQAVARVGQDRLGEPLGDVGIAMHRGGVDHSRSFPDGALNRAGWVRGAVRPTPPGGACLPVAARPRTGRRCHGRDLSGGVASAG